MVRSVFTVQELMYALVTDLEYPTWEDLSCLGDLQEEDRTELASFWGLVSQVRRLRVAHGCRELAQDSSVFRGGALFRFLLSDHDPQIRTEAVRALGLDPEVASFTAVLAQMKAETDEWVRIAAASSIGCFLLAGELEPWPVPVQTQATALLIGWSQDGSADLIGAALPNLGFSSRPEVKEVLTQNLVSSWEVRREAALAGIANTADVRWESRIMKVWHEDMELSVRTAALKAAGQLGLQVFLDICLNVIEFENEIQLRLGAIEALGNIGGAVAARGLAYAADTSDEEQFTAAKMAMERMDSDAGAAGSILN